MATVIYVSPNNKREVILTNGVKVPLPFSTTDATMQTNIQASAAFVNGDIVINNSYTPPQPDIQLFTTVDL